MPNLINNHKGIPFPTITIQDAINQIKLDYETAIRNGTKASTIRIIYHFMQLLASANTQILF